MKRIRILLVDDHSLFRKGLSALFAKEESFEVVGEAGDGIDAVKKAKQLKPDIVLMDISMPGADGIEAARGIRATLPSAKVVMLTILEEDQKLFEAIKAGAHGYLLKNVKPSSLFETLQGAMRGEAAISRITASKILKQFGDQARQPLGENGPEKLTDRELEVLRCVTKGQSNKEIAGSLHIAENTVKNHLKNILDKLHLQNRVQAATFALEKGLVPDDTPPS